MIREETRRRFVKDVAAAFPEVAFTHERNEAAYGVVCESNGLWAGAAVNAEQAWITFADTDAPTDSAEAAIALLNAVFADEIVAVAAYEGDVLVGQALANSSDLHRPPHLLVPLDPRTISRVDKLHVRSWSGALDGIRSWPRAED